MNVVVPRVCLSAPRGGMGAQMRWGWPHGGSVGAGAWVLFSSLFTFICFEVFHNKTLKGIE